MIRLCSLACPFILLIHPTGLSAFTQQTQHYGATIIRPFLSSPLIYDTSTIQLRHRLHSRFIPIYSASSASDSASSFHEKDSSSTSFWTKWVTGVDHPQRPIWARNWMPTWLVRLRPCLQLVITAVLYIFHLTVLAQHSLPFPIQLIPNERGHFQNIGLDSIAGMACLGAYYYYRRKSNDATNKHHPSIDNATINATASAEMMTTTKISHVLPNLLSAPPLNETPWKNVYRSKYSRLSSFLGLMALFQAYLWTGRFSIWWEDAIYYLANFYPITVAMHRSLCVLCGHLTWIAFGGTILRLVPRPQSFFDQTWYTQRYSDGPDGAKSNYIGGSPQWLWWTIGGYFVSSWLFNIADFMNQWILPIPILEQAQESVVSQLINPEMNDWWASIVGYIAPCITAPWWEEVLYRGFLLPALVLQFKYKWAVFWSGILFSAHHLSATAFIPLMVLGWVWSILYAKSGNLLTTILIHAMWNSRIFLGSWFGL